MPIQHTETFYYKTGPEAESRNQYFSKQANLHPLILNTIALRLHPKE
jgi:hypothetical protein